MWVLPATRPNCVVVGRPTRTATVGALGWMCAADDLPAGRHTASASAISTSSGTVASKIRPHLPDLSGGLPDLTAPAASDFNRRAAFTKSASSEFDFALPERPRAEALLAAGTEAGPSTSSTGTFEASDRRLPEGLATVSGPVFSSSDLEASFCSST